MQLCLLNDLRPGFSPSRIRPKMELNAVQQYRPTSNRSFTISQNPGHGLHLMYPYGSVPQQPQQPQQQQQHQQHQQPQPQPQPQQIMQQPQPQQQQQQPPPPPPQQQQHQQQQQQLRPVPQAVAQWTMGNGPTAYQSQPNNLMMKPGTPRPQMPQTDSAPDVTFSQAPVMSSQPYRDLTSQAPTIHSDIFQSSLLDTSKSALQPNASFA
jgi:hypothetical protein